MPPILLIAIQHWFLMLLSYRAEAQESQCATPTESAHIHCHCQPDPVENTCTQTELMMSISSVFVTSLCRMTGEGSKSSFYSQGQQVVSVCAYIINQIFIPGDIYGKSNVMDCEQARSLWYVLQKMQSFGFSNSSFRMWCNVWGSHSECMQPFSTFYKISPDYPFWMAVNGEWFMRMQQRQGLSVAVIVLQGPLNNGFHSG